MFDANPFDDGRGRYPDRISTQVPRGFRRVVSFAVRKAAQAADAARNTATARLAVMPGSEALRAIYGARAPSVFDNLLTRAGAGGAATIGARNKLVNPPASPNP
jgi:hypothetical protein